VDTAGNVTASRKYDVYGLVRAGGSGTSRHKFVGSLGHTSEDETGLIYMRARWMDPSLGRFISEDSARDGANWFEYCRGNPVNAVDPDGREWYDAAIDAIFNTIIGMIGRYCGLDTDFLDGLAGLEGYREKISYLRSVIRASRAAQDAEIAAGTVIVEGDRSGLAAGEGALIAQHGLAGKAVCTAADVGLRTVEAMLGIDGMWAFD